MKHKKFLDTAGFLSIYQDYLAGYSIKEIAKRSGVSHITVYKNLKEIQSALAGEPITRKKMANDLRTAVAEIHRQREERRNAKAEKMPEISSPVETPDPYGRVDRAWNELKQALSDLAVFLADQRLGAVSEAAKKSNLVGLIDQAWSARK